VPLFAVPAMETDTFIFMATVICAVVPWAFSIHAKVAVIASAVETLPEIVEELRTTLQEPAHRLDRHDGQIEALQQTTGPGR